MKANKHILYKTTASKIGVGANEVRVPEYPRDGHFSKVIHFYSLLLGKIINFDI